MSRLPLPALSPDTGLCRLPRVEGADPQGPRCRPAAIFLVPLDCVFSSPSFQGRCLFCTQNALIGLLRRLRENWRENLSSCFKHGQVVTRGLVWRRDR